MSRISEHFLGDAYPVEAGWKGTETSVDAARAVTATLSERHEEVLRALRLHGPLTADEIAEKIGRTVLAVRPRLSELGKHLNKIERTGKRRLNASRLSANVWQIRR